MLHFVSGDILLTKAPAIAHGVAPNDHFDSGLAMSLRQEWPAMYKDFRHYCHTRECKSGSLWAWVGADGTRIINLLTQNPPPSHNQRPGPASATHVGHALHALSAFIDKEKITALALPRLATGVGRMDWADVKPLIERHLGPIEIPIYVYETFHAGQQADEPGVQALHGGDA
jgi:O-acetyl-ADP-ribose deacetylase (regulator of RNase III)